MRQRSFTFRKSTASGATFNSEHSGIVSPNTKDDGIDVVRRALGLEHDHEGFDDVNSTVAVAGDAVSESSSWSDKDDTYSRPSSSSARTRSRIGGYGGDFHEARHLCCLRLVDNRLFTGLFMTLTMYSLFAPDIDQIVGNKTSKLVLSIVNTVVCGLFVIEIIVQSFGKSHYFRGAFFWLDAVAMVSLLPETWLMSAVLEGDNGFAPGRSSRLARVIRVASRSSKAARLNRLTRVARVATLVPKIGALLGPRVNEQEVERLVDKKLRRVFRLLDDDGYEDGKIEQNKVERLLEAMRGSIEQKAKKSTTSKSALPFSSRNSEKENKPHSESSSKSLEDDNRQSEGEGSMSNTVFHIGMLEHVQSGGGTTDRGERVTSAADADQSVGRVPSTQRSARRSYARGPSPSFGEDDLHADRIDFGVFSAMVKQDPYVGPRFRTACEKHLRKGNKVESITKRYSEAIAVRVALAVILTLFVLSFLVTPDVQDRSLTLGLQQLTEAVKFQFPNATVGSQVPAQITRQVSHLLRRMGSDTPRRVFVLDINRLVYCDTFRYGENNCSVGPDSVAYWGPHYTPQDLENIIEDSDHRPTDVLKVTFPELDDTGISFEEEEERTDSVAWEDVKGAQQMVAVMSICTTVAVIVIILSGIASLTLDLNNMSRNLLKPLRELADDMESIAQLQLAGADDDVGPINQGTDEIKQIRKTFENTKKAIKSWGKYVPWPVVQRLLRAGIEAEPNVDNVEVSIYFSDIAGFTTIVESLPPERSLMLLNRYFNDMTKVIDEGGGVVIEFIGDAILAVYGHPLPNQFHTAAAAKGAIKMLAALKRINDWCTKQKPPLPEVNIRCGIHTGEVLVGNIGFHSRIKFGLVGENSQIPMRLEELNKTYKTECLISSYALSMLLPRMFVTRPVDLIHLSHEPGSQPEYIHEVIDRERRHEKFQSLREAADEHAVAMELYMKRSFVEARAKFEKIRQAMVEVMPHKDDDGASSLMIQRCTSYLEKPPPEGWNGVWDRVA